MSCETDAERAVFSVRQGDDWVRRWECAGSGRTYDAASLVVEIRVGDDSSGRLVASSVADRVPGDDEANPVAAIDLTGPDFEAEPKVIAMLIAAADTAPMSPEADMTIEAECEVDGAVTTILRHRWSVAPQVAVAP